mmetsp:Transcript_23316/g.49237  ORF Transcript_23316/g.49237 Transcript_23316/m.49237 type:complete len:342 (+) Transcript_23316:164-1189(+)
MGFSMKQKQALSIIPHITGALSITGSLSILYDILSDRKRKLQRPYYRILLGMSIFDALTSFWVGLSTWPIPRGTPGVYAAVGTTATCTAQGFFIQLMVMSPLYNLMLSIYYFLVGKHHLTDEEIATRYEKFMHVCALAVGFGFAILGLPLTLYNNANLWCWIAAYPPECEDNSGEHGDVPCERGHDSWLYRWIIFYIPVWIVIVVVTIIMYLLFCAVRNDEKKIVDLQLEHRNQRTSETISNSSNIPNDSLGFENERTSGKVDKSVLAFRQRDRLERSNRLFQQAKFYLAVFYATWVFVTINRLIQLISGGSSFAMMLLHSFFGPSQGFFNFLVYRHGSIA